MHGVEEGSGASFKLAVRIFPQVRFCLHVARLRLCWLHCPAMPALPVCALPVWRRSTGLTSLACPAPLSPPQGWVRVGSYRTAALAAAAHDHVLLWHTLHSHHSAPAGGGGPAAAAHAAELPLEQATALVEGLESCLNWLPQRYLTNSALLLQLGTATFQQLLDHLRPHALAEWEPTAAGANGPGGDAGGGAAAVASAAALRKDNTSSFLGVSRNTGGASWAAGITGGCCAVPGCALHACMSCCRVLCRAVWGPPAGLQAQVESRGAAGEADAVRLAGGAPAVAPRLFAFCKRNECLNLPLCSPRQARVPWQLPHRAGGGGGARHRHAVEAAPR